MAMELSSRSFTNGKPIPKQYTRDGKDTSPPLEWRGAPEGTHSFALVCDDPDAPSKVWVHWVLWDLPAGTHELREGVPNEPRLDIGAAQGRNDSGKTGYGGPAPPPGKPHRYFFKLYALDAPLGLQPGATKQQLLAAMQGHVLEESQIVGTYAR